MTYEDHITRAFLDAGRIYGVDAGSLRSARSIHWNTDRVCAKYYIVSYLHWHIGLSIGVIADIVNMKPDSVSVWLRNENLQSATFKSENYCL